MHTVLVCGSAFGEYLPPLVVYKGQHLYEACRQNGPENAGYSCSPSRWMSDTGYRN